MSRVLLPVSLPVALAGVLSMVGGCGGPQHIERLEPDVDTELSGHWSDTDARETASALTGAALQGRWLTEFAASQGRMPALRVRPVVNETSEHIDGQLFVKSLERAFVDSGQITMLAQDGAETDAVHAEQAKGVAGELDPVTAPLTGQETGADFVVTLRLASIVDRRQGERTKFYKIDMELIDPVTAEKKWIGAHEIKKLITQAAVRW